MPDVPAKPSRSDVTAAMLTLLIANVGVTAAQPLTSDWLARDKAAALDNHMRIVADELKAIRRDIHNIQLDSANLAIWSDVYYREVFDMKERIKRVEALSAKAP